MSNKLSGILPIQHINELFLIGALSSQEPIVQGQVQPASLDLRLGKKAYRVRASFMPGRNVPVYEKLERFKLHEFDLNDGAVLETGCVYIIPLLEKLDLPEDVAASANPKSSTGRLDIFTRVIADGAQEFDKVPAGYCGPLYLEVSPRTFPIVVRTGSRLSQIRFRKGHALLDSTDLAALHQSDVLAVGGQPILTDGALSLSIDLNVEGEKPIGYRGKRHTAVIDVDKPNSYNVYDYWEPLYARGAAQIVLDPDQFYILMSAESVHVPPLYAAEMVPYDPLVGEFRVHYAGFFDPGFGHSAAGGTGSRAVLEVRSHEVPFILEHGQIVGSLVYEHMLEKPDVLYGADLKSNYQAQGLKLSKHFKAN